MYTIVGSLKYVKAPKMTWAWSCLCIGTVFGEAFQIPNLSFNMGDLGSPGGK